MNRPFLAQPSEVYRDSFIEALRELAPEGKDEDPDQISANFNGFLDDLAQQERPDYGPGWLPERIFWLIDDGIWIGQISIRYGDNEKWLMQNGNIGYHLRPSKRRQGYGTILLRLGLEKAHELGLTKVLLTCDEDNIGSRKVIEANGGVIETFFEIPGVPVKSVRYSIAIG